jgi:hypothetical protein
MLSSLQRLTARAATLAARPKFEIPSRGLSTKNFIPEYPSFFISEKISADDGSPKSLDRFGRSIISTLKTNSGTRCINLSYGNKFGELTLLGLAEVLNYNEGIEDVAITLDPENIKEESVDYFCEVLTGNKKITRLDLGIEFQNKFSHQWRRIQKILSLNQTMEITKEDSSVELVRMNERPLTHFDVMKIYEREFRMFLTPRPDLSFHNIFEIAAMHRDKIEPLLKTKMDNPEEWEKILEENKVPPKDWRYKKSLPTIIEENEQAFHLLYNAGVVYNKESAVRSFIDTLSEGNDSYYKERMGIVDGFTAYKKMVESQVYSPSSSPSIRSGTVIDTKYREKTPNKY